MLLSFKTTLPPVPERVRKSCEQGLSPTRQECSPKMRNFYNCRNAIEIPLKRQPTFKVVSHPLLNCALCHLQERNSPPVARLRFQSGVCRQKSVLPLSAVRHGKRFTVSTFSQPVGFCGYPVSEKFFLTVPPVGVCGKMCLFLLG